MKKITWIVCISWIQVACIPTAPSNDPNYLLHQMNIKGNVSETIDSLYFYDSTGRWLSDSISFDHTYWKNNLPVSIIETDSSGHKNSVRMFFTTDGKLLKTESRRKDSILSSYFFRYDSVTGLGEMTHYQKGVRDMYANEIAMDQYKNIISARSFSGDSVFQFSAVQSYDKWNKIAGVFRDSSGSLYAKQFYILNEYGDPIRDSAIIYQKGVPGTYVTRFTYPKYDSHKNWREKIETDSAGKPRKRVIRNISYSK